LGDWSDGVDRREREINKGLVMRGDLLRLDSFFAKLSFLVQKYLDKTKRRKMNDCRDWDPIREELFKLL
jgi:hypothetical protein